MTAARLPAGAELAGRLGSWFDAVLGGGPHAVVDLERLSGGASRETFTLGLAVGPDPGPDPRPLILQRVRPGGVSRLPGVAVEADLLRAAAVAGVPVPGVVGTCADPEVAGNPFLVVERLPGDTLARRVLEAPELDAARGSLLAQCGAALAAIHRMPVDVLDGEPGDPLREAAGLLDLFGPAQPALELGLRWLVRHRPPAGPTAIVHGDFRLGNLLVDPEVGLRAVLDWELAHLGDPLEDLGWFCTRAWRFGAPAPAAGLGQRPELWAAYEAAGGAAVDPEAARWWEVYGCVRWGVICLVQLAAHLSGAAPSVELAAIGRRVCEAEYDVLRLLAPATVEALPALPVDPAVAGFAPQDRPAAGALLEAVADFLDEEVRSATTGRVRFHAKVAANVVAMVARELAVGPASAAAHADRLAGLGVADDAELAAAVRAGGFDDRWDELGAAAGAAVAAKVAVVNPDYADDAPEWG